MRGVHGLTGGAAGGCGGAAEPRETAGMPRRARDGPQDAYARVTPVSGPHARVAGVSVGSPQGFAVSPSVSPPPSPVGSGETGASLLGSFDGCEGVDFVGVSEGSSDGSSEGRLL